MQIDIHSHVIPDRIVAAIAANPKRFRARVEGEGTARKIIHDQGYIYPLFDEFRQVEAKVGPSPARLRGMATVPMQHPDAAVAELERVVRAYGFKAVELGTSIEGAQLAEERFRPLLRRAAELNVFVFAHPYYVGAKAGLENYYLTNLIGNPLDTTVMLANLMFSGRLDELPELKLVLAHGGGFAPYQIGRLVHGHKVRSEANGITKSSPKELLKRIYFDSLVFEPQALRYLIDVVGADHICIGTDAPFDMADNNPQGTIAAVPGLTAKERQCVCCGTALKLLCEGSGKI